MTNKHVSIIIFMLTLTCYSYFVQSPGWNQSSHMALIMSIANRHQLNIDPYQGSTGDKAFYKGHYYSDKAIGVAVLGVPAYIFFSNLQHLNLYPSMLADIRYPLYLVTLISVALPSALLCVLLYQVLLMILAPRRTWAFVLTLFYSFGTMAFPFSVMLFEHQAAAVFSFATFYVLLKVRQRPDSPWLLALAGTLAGLGVLMEYQALIIAIALFVYAALVVRRKILLTFFLLGGLPWALVLLGYNDAAFGGILQLGYNYEANPDFGAMKTGFFGITLPRWSSLVTILVGPLGLLRLSVFLWFVPFGVWQAFRLARWRRECVLCLVIFLVFVLWNAGYYLPLGGNSPGPRFLVVALPFLMIPMAFVPLLPRLLLRTFSAPLAQVLVVGAGLWSVAVFFLITATDPLPADGPQMSNPIFRYWIPLFQGQHFLMNVGMLRFNLGGLQSLIPLVICIVVAVDAYIILAWRPITRRWFRQFSGAGTLALAYVIVAPPANLLHPHEVPTRAPGSIWVSAIVPQPNKVAAGETLSFKTSVSGNPSQTVIVDYEAFDAANKQVFSTYSVVTIGSGRLGRSMPVWQVPANAPQGTYRLAIGLFTSNWSYLYNWNNSAASFTVGAPRTQKTASAPLARTIAVAGGHRVVAAATMVPGNSASFKADGHSPVHVHNAIIPFPVALVGLPRG